MPPPPPPPGPPPPPPSDAPGVSANAPKSVAGPPPGTATTTTTTTTTSPSAPPTTTTATRVDDQPGPPALDAELHATLSNIERIPSRNTLLIINSFVVNTVDFVNKFGSLCERKLSRITDTVRRIEIVLALLEGKLDSVDWLNDGEAPPGGGGGGEVKETNDVAPGETDTKSDSADGEEALVAAAAPAANVLTVAQDSRYKKYFLMINNGVPKAALAPRLTMEGLDPALLDTPDAPAPPGGQAADAAENSDSEEEVSEEDFD